MPLQQKSKPSTKKKSPPKKPTIKQSRIEKAKTDNKTAIKLFAEMVWGNKDVWKSPIEKELQPFDYDNISKGVFDATRITLYTPLKADTIHADFDYEIDGKEFVDYLKKWCDLKLTDYIPLHKDTAINGDEIEAITLYSVDFLEPLLKYHKINPIKKVYFSREQPMKVEFKKGSYYVAPRIEEVEEDDDGNIINVADTTKPTKEIINLVKQGKFTELFEKNPEYIKALDYATTESSFSLNNGSKMFLTMVKEWHDNPLQWDVSTTDNRNLNKMKKSLQNLSESELNDVIRFFMKEDSLVVYQGRIDSLWNDETKKYDMYYSHKHVGAREKPDIPLTKVFYRERTRRWFYENKEQLKKTLEDLKRIELMEDFTHLSFTETTEIREALREVIKDIEKEKKKWAKQKYSPPPKRTAPLDNITEKPKGKEVIFDLGKDGRIKPISVIDGEKVSPIPELPEQYFVLAEDGSTQSISMGLSENWTEETAQKTKEYVEELTGKKHVVIRARTYPEAFDKVEKSKPKEQRTPTLEELKELLQRKTGKSASTIDKQIKQTLEDMDNFITELGAAHIVGRHHGIDINNALQNNKEFNANVRKHGFYNESGEPKGTPSPHRSKKERVWDEILVEEDGLHIDQLVQKTGFSKKSLMPIIMSMLESGDIYEPSRNVFKRI